MKHPTPEDWLSFVYDEVAPAQQREWRQHLESCAECRAHVEARWRTLTRLDDWRLAPPRHAAAPLWQPLKWAAAAAVVFGIGFGVARLTASPPDLVAVENRLREQMGAEFANLSQRQAAQTAQYHDAIVRVLGNLEAQRRTDLARLQRDVETVAVLAEDGLATTQEQLVQLASTTIPVTPVSLPLKDN
jgi:hypothetical protein